ncbi:MAG: hypothetical protein KAY32_15085 [Candidatus Eisenbacteria sp.]|nr:hypothetical protein [Candidatus Eisenbacteria bacterium]
MDRLRWTPAVVVADTLLNDPANVTAAEDYEVVQRLFEDLIEGAGQDVRDRDAQAAHEDLGEVSGARSPIRPRTTPSGVI